MRVGHILILHTQKKVKKANGRHALTVKSGRNIRHPSFLLDLYDATAGEIAPSTLVHILPLGRISTESWKNDRAQLSDFYI